MSAGAGTAEDEAFDLAAPLPGAGVTVLEASAGTGKTFTLAALVTRYVATGVPISGILAVTFTRMATGELRERVRRQVASTSAALAEGARPADDPVAAVLADAAPDELEARRRRLSDALADFDAATIATTHGFCQLVLDGLGTAGDVATDVALLEDPDELVAEVVDDLYLRWVLARAPLPFDVATARIAARAVIDNPGTAVCPGDGDQPAELLARLARAAAGEVERRLAVERAVTYDQLLVRLARTLADAERGPLACQRLRRRWPVVLVDEFQDTDPVQWDILRMAFASDPCTLVLVGDPKQAIYAFRGADVRAYLAAAATAARRATLAVNRRSDQQLLDATAALLDPLQLGDERIRFRRVQAAPGREPSPVAGAPLTFRLVDATTPGVVLTSSKQIPQKDSLRARIAADVAETAAATIASGVRPSDVAVLTRTNPQAVEVREALRAAGVPAVVAGLDSVFGSDAALAWLRLLTAVEEPASRSAIAALALTSFVGWTAGQVASAADRDWEEVHDRARRWATVLAERGVAALARTVTAEELLPARVLRAVDGERWLTDAGHVAQLLHAESVAGRAGGAALRAWLADRVERAGEERNDADARSRRLDSDAEAVQVMTVHRAKGLEWSVVLCPSLWDPAGGGDRSGPVIFHDPTGRRSLHVGWPRTFGGLSPDRVRAVAAANAEAVGEDLRLLYVAVTRARHRVVLWWGRGHRSHQSPLARLLLARDPLTGEVSGDRLSKEPRDREIREAVEVVASRAPGLVGVEVVGAGAILPGAPGSPWAPGVAHAPAAVAGGGMSGGGGVSDGGGSARGGAPGGDGLEAARFDRPLDLRWRRTSYTALTSAAHGERGDRIGSEPERGTLGDEPDEALAEPADRVEPREDGADTDLPLDDLPGGRAVGTWVHGLLEHVDFAAPDLDAHLKAAAAQRAAALPEDVTGRRGPEAAAAWAAGLALAARTPLDPLLPGAGLRSIARADRLDELGFELPLAGGDRPAGEVETADLAALLARHLDPAGPLGGYPERLADPLLASSLRGYLTGSLDLVWRAAPRAGSRWYLADYKTNRLGPVGRPASVWDYAPDALDAEMQRRHYPLQALLYLVALHRYLGWRLAGYDPEAHLGGVTYLFVRGMAGERTPLVDGRRCGVWTWSPPAALVVETAELLGSGR